MGSVQFSCSVVSNSSRPHELQHARPPCPSPTPGVYSNSCPSSRWCHPAISSSVIPFSSCPQSLPASRSFPTSQLFAWGSQSTGVSASASVLPVNTQDWSLLGWTGWISLQSKGLSRVHPPIKQKPMVDAQKITRKQSKHTLTENHQITKKGSKRRKEQWKQKAIKQLKRNSKETSTSASLTAWKPLTVWITTNCGKFWKRWDYQTTLPASWEICMQVRKQQLESDMEQLTGSKLEKQYVKAVYCHPVYLTSMQNTSCEMMGWVNHQLELRLLGEISTVS